MFGLGFDSKSNGIICVSKISGTHGHCIYCYLASHIRSFQTNVIAKTFGSQCSILALDAALVEGADAANPKWEVVILSGKERTGRDAIDWAKDE